MIRAVGCLVYCVGAPVEPFGFAVAALHEVDHGEPAERAGVIRMVLVARALVDRHCTLEQRFGFPMTALDAQDTRQSR